MAPFFGRAQTNPPTPAELPKVLLMGDSISGRMKEWMIPGAESVAFTYSRKPA